VSILEITVYVITGFAAGVVNAVAGGGTFFTFAAMVAFGMPTLNANATSAIALVPGSFASTMAYWPEIRDNWRQSLAFAVLGIVGGIIGAVILVAIGDEGFRPLVPWLLGVATFLFAFSPQIRALGQAARGRSSFDQQVLAYLAMGLVGVYGGFFGAGMGIMMLAALSIIHAGDFHASNTLKNITGTVAQATAVVLFIAKGLVFWQAAAVVTAAGVAGGYLGIVVARRVPERIVRIFVVVVGAALTVIFFFN
jgi:uncharacterized membrane protein YfcA